MKVKVAEFAKQLTSDGFKTVNGKEACTTAQDKWWEREPKTAVSKP